MPAFAPPDQPGAALRPPGVRWGYSGEGFVLLQRLLEQQSGCPMDELANLYVFEPLAMRDSRLDAPEPGYHGYRPLITTAADYGLFLAHVLGLDDERWQLQWQIDDELGWGLAWGLELGPTLHGWQWGLNDDASAFVIGSPVTGDGVVVLTDSAEGRDYYRGVVQRELPGDHASLRVEHNRAWLDLFV